MRYSALVLDSSELVDDTWTATEVSYYTRNDIVFERSEFRGSSEDGLEAFNNPSVTVYVNNKRGKGIIVRVPEYHSLFNVYLISHEDDMCIETTPGVTSEHRRTIGQLTGVVGEYITNLSRAVKLKDITKNKYKL